MEEHAMSWKTVCIRATEQIKIVLLVLAVTSWAIVRPCWADDGRQSSRGAGDSSSSGTSARDTSPAHSAGEQPVSARRTLGYPTVTTAPQQMAKKSAAENGGAFSEDESKSSEGNAAESSEGKSP